MECAMEQLGLYTREQKYDSAKKQQLLLERDGINPCVYEYTKPANDNLVSGTIYSQAQLYYSRFYVDENIKEHIELCPILSASQEELEKPGEYKLTWYVRAPGHPQEYTHYSFNKSDGSSERAGQPIIRKILTSLRKKNRTTKNPVYGFYTVKRRKILTKYFSSSKKMRRLIKSIVV